MMEIVINISEKEYNYYRDASNFWGYSKLREIILNGKPLPKGHGRLGDLSKIYVELNERQIEGTEEYKGLGEAKQIVCNAPTIIEAESEE